MAQVQNEARFASDVHRNSSVNRIGIVLWRRAWSCLSEFRRNASKSYAVLAAKAPSLQQLVFDSGALETHYGVYVEPRRMTLSEINLMGLAPKIGETV